MCTPYSMVVLFTPVCSISSTLVSYLVADYAFVGSGPEGLQGYTAPSGANADSCVFTAWRHS